MQTTQLVIPLFALMTLGYALKKGSFFSDGFVGDLNRFIFYIALPVTLFQQTSDMGDAFSGAGVAAVMQPLTIVSVAIVATILTFRANPARRGPFTQASYRANMAYLGLPIAATVYGDAALGIIAVTIAAGVVSNSVVSILVLRMNDPEAGGQSLWVRLLDVAKNPLIIAIALGFGFSLTGLELPPVVDETLSLLQRVSLPLVLLVVGYSFSFTRVSSRFMIAVGAAGLKLLFMPMFAWAVLTWGFGVEGFVRSVIVLMTAMPTAIASQSFAAAFNADEQLAAATVSFSTLASLLTIPLWIHFLS
ncbi:MAG: AEC family transporter [bacterium]